MYIDVFLFYSILTFALVFGFDAVGFSVFFAWVAFGFEGFPVFLISFLTSALGFGSALLATATGLLPVLYFLLLKYCRFLCN
jgi:hypothetical protein